MKRKSPPRVFFNASVILAGINSPTGGSGLLLLWVTKKKIDGVVSEIVLSEVFRHAEKIGISKLELEIRVRHLFPSIAPAPSLSLVVSYQSKMLDVGNAHVLASTIQQKCQYLVTLDKKHLLIIAEKFKKVCILSPGQLIQRLRK